MTEYVEVKTSELEGAALDWAVAMADGHEAVRPQDGQTAKQICPDYWRQCLCGPQSDVTTKPYEFSPSTNWAQGGPLIDEYDVWQAGPEHYAGPFAAWIEGTKYESSGPTRLIAAMRAIVASEMGETVQVPKELMS